MIYSVALYETRRSYGGSEEGGWWYDEGQPVDPSLAQEWGFSPLLTDDLTIAKEYKTRLLPALQELNQGRNRHREPIYEVEIHEGFPTSYPSERPFYE